MAPKKKKVVTPRPDIKSDHEALTNQIRNIQTRMKTASPEEKKTLGTRMKNLVDEFNKKHK